MFSLDALEKMLFLDIETVSSHPQYTALPERIQELWDKKARYFQDSDGHPGPSTLYEQKAGIYAEFAKVVCVSCGYLRFNKGEGSRPESTLKVKSFYGSDEKVLLDAFGKLLNDWALDNLGRPHTDRTLCAHNGKEFDFPFLGRRFLIQQLELPEMLKIQGKKPWEIPYVDTMELWKFGDYKAYTSLDLLAAIFEVPSPKDDIDGSQVGKVFWEEQDLERIKTYCEKDVLTTANVLLKMCRMPLATMQVV
ncbi:MAG: ribonuclease H-like domain-containing protein [Bacteroidota bacterium]